MSNVSDVTIFLDDVNDNTPVFTSQEPYEFVLPETVFENDVIGQVQRNLKLIYCI